MNNFVPLHIVSCYSFLQSGLTIEKIQAAGGLLKYLKSLGSQISLVTNLQKIWNVAAATNPYVWIGAAVAAIATLTFGITKLTKSNEDLEDKTGDVERAVRSEGEEVSELVLKLKDSKFKMLIQ